MITQIENYEDLISSLIENKVTMVHPDEFKMVLNHYDKISKIEGDVVECGCWRGGFSIFLSHVFSDKNIWVFDSFEGFQPLENSKYSYSAERHVPSFNQTGLGPMGISLDEVKGHFKSYRLEDDRIKFIKGFVKDSLPTSGIETISLLRVDVDAYSATLETLDELYDKVQPGGYIIFDDSCLYETLDAIKTFFRTRNLPNYIYHPVTDVALDLYQSHVETNSGFPAGCYIVKQ